jgi:hypothetical protein
MTDIAKGARVVFPITVGGLGRENHRTLCREGTVVSTWREHGAERARIREDSDHYASGRGYVTRLLDALVPTTSLAGQQRLAEGTWNDRYTGWERAGKPVHPWCPLVPGAIACWQCGHKKDSVYHQVAGRPDADLVGICARDAQIVTLQCELLDHAGHVRAGLPSQCKAGLVARINHLRAANGWPSLDMRGRQAMATWTCPGCGASYPEDDLGLITGHVGACDYVDDLGQEYDVTIKWSVTRWHIATAKSSDLAAAAGARPFSDLRGRVLDPDDDDPDDELPTYLDDLATSADCDPASDGWEISDIYDARRDQPRA